MKRVIMLVLSLVMALSLCAPAWGVEESVDPNNITAACANLPVAAVTVLGTEDTIENEEGTTIFDKNLTIDTANSKMGADLGAFSLDAAYQFEPTETLEQAKASDYRYWHADFVVYADKDVPDNSMALAGYYEAWCSFNEYKWVALTNDGLPISANEEVRLVYGMGNGSISVNYEELCTYGNDGTGFLCGVADLGGNEGATITVELRLYETEAPSEENGNSHNVETGRYAIIGTHSYTFSPVAVIDDVEYDTLQEAVDAAENEDTITVMANGLSAVVNEAKVFTVVYDEGVTKEAAITAADGYAVSVDNGVYTVVKTYKVSFNTAGGDPVPAEQTINAGETVAKPADPTKEGYIFKGWALGNAEYDFSAPVNENITLVAVWVEEEKCTSDSHVKVLVEYSDDKATKVYCDSCGMTFAFVQGTEDEAEDEFGAGNYAKADDNVWYALKDQSGEVPSVPPVEDVEVNFSVSEDGTVTIETVNLDKITSEEVETDSVTLDFSDVDDINIVDIPTGVVGEIEEVLSSPSNAISNLEIVTAEATVTFDTDATKKINENAKNANAASVRLTVDVQHLPTATDITPANREAFKEVMEKEGSENAVLLSLELVGGTAEVFSADNAAGTATVKVKLANGLKSATLYYLNGDKVEELGSYDADAAGYITITLTHFSEYMLLGSTTTTPTDPPSGNNRLPINLGGDTTTTTEDNQFEAPTTFDAGIALYVGMSVVAAVGAVTLSKKRED